MIATGTTMRAGMLSGRDWETGDSSDTATHSEAVREQTERVLADPLFHNSKRYSDLLRYIVEKTLENHHECLKERIIGIEVFDRTPDYDTTVDSIVRGAAAEVRKRLTRYYQHSSHGRELRIELPMRCYVAEFRRPDPKEVSISHEEAAAVPPDATSSTTDPEAVRMQPSMPASFNRSLSYLILALVVAVLSCGAWAARRMFTPAPVRDRLWSPVLDTPGKVLISIGSPSRDAQPPPPESTVIVAGDQLGDAVRKQLSFPLSEMSAGSDMSAFLSRHGKESAIYLSGSTSLSDLHGRPLVIIGSYPNQWAVRLGASLPFQFRSVGGVHWIEDTRHPDDKTWLLDMHAPVERVTNEYSLITRVYDPTTEQWWLGVGGLTALGTLATEKLVMDPKTMEAFGTQLPNGWDRKNLQIVVQTNMVNGSLGASRAIATRIW